MVRPDRVAERLLRNLASTAARYGLTQLVRTAEQTVGSLTAGIASQQVGTALDRLATQVGNAV